MIEEGQNFAAFRQQNVQAHLETALTPVGALDTPTRTSKAAREDRMFWC